MMVRTRRHRSPEEIEEILALYRRGGVTQRELAERHGVCLGTIQNWLRRRFPSASDGKPGWIELIPDATKPARAYRIEFRGGLTLALGPGWRAAEVRELVEAITSR